MATDSFKFWDAYYDALKFLKTDRQRSEFIMGLCAFVFDGEEPTFSDDVAEFGFRLVRTQAEMSKEIARRARENGKKSSGRPRKKPTAKPRQKPTAKPVGLTNRSEEKRSDYSNESLRDSSRDAPEACAPAPAPTVDERDMPPET